MSNFKNIIGHEQIIEHLSTALKQDKVSHAYIFQGPDGSGKSVVAQAFAKALQCEAGYGDACEMCHSCIQVESGNQPDIKWVSHEKPASIGVTDIREQVNNDIGIKPYSSKYKIYIIDEAEKMTVQAQNALLKTIEEPPAYGIIMLLVNDAQTLLPTIRSRCVMLSLRPVEEKKIIDFLMKNYEVPDYKAKVCAAFSRGVVGKAIALATSEEYNELQNHILNMLKHIDDMKIYQIMDSIKYLSGHKVDVYDIIDMMEVWYRDILMLKATNDPNLLVYKDEYNFLSRRVKKSSYEGLEAIIEAMEKAKSRLAANVNFDVAMELMLLAIKEN